MSGVPIVYGAFGEEQVTLDEKRYRYGHTEFIVPDPTGNGFYPVYLMEKVPYLGPKENSIEDLIIKVDSALREECIRRLDTVQKLFDRKS